MRMGVDVGGTFTDVVLETTDGLTTTKVLTTHVAPERAILEGIEEVTGRADVGLDAVDSILHGTTLATNALIERSGAPTAFITTAGFRDVVETRTESRFEQYDLDIVLPTPLVARRDRFVVRERTAADGTVLVPFDAAGGVAVVDEIAVRGYEAVAIGFLHSYRDPRHEHRMRELLLERLPDLAVSISAEVSPQMREYERFSTVCANAYVQPAMSRYLHRLRDGLAAAGARCPVHMVHSGGGLMSLDAAARFPIRLVESGPAGGAMFAADLAARHGLGRVLSYDMGGTTAKICLVEDHTPRTATTFEVARTQRFAKGSGTPVTIPVIEMIEIGAGGGSIAGIDHLGRIAVGPRSAGSEPGPACYDRGGTEPTVTDADVVLGRLSADTFGAATIDLAPERAHDALRRVVGDDLGIDVDEAALAVAEVVDENMANAARVHAVENGRDVAAYTMIAFGGAAPVHAARLCDKLGIETLVVPPDAGVGSAIGFLRAPFAHEAVQSHYLAIEHPDVTGVTELLDELARRATSFVTEGVTADGSTTRIEIERTASMRYAGQGWEIPVEIPPGPFDARAAAGLGERFEKAYEEFFGRTIDGLPIEAVSWSVRAVAPLADPDPVAPTPPVDRAATGPTRRLHDPGTGASPAGVVDATVVQRHDLGPGRRVDGPAVVVEPQTTTVVPSGRHATCAADGSLIITRTAP